MTVDTSLTPSCPECGGPLDRADTEVGSYQCTVGHKYTSMSLYDAQREYVEAALWAAVRALRERAAVAQRLSSRDATGRFGARAREAEDASRLIEGLLTDGPAGRSIDPEPDDRLAVGDGGNGGGGTLAEAGYRAAGGTGGGGGGPRHGAG